MARSARLILANTAERGHKRLLQHIIHIDNRLQNARKTGPHVAFQCAVSRKQQTFQGRNIALHSLRDQMRFLLLPHELIIAQALRPMKGLVFHLIVR